MDDLSEFYRDDSPDLFEKCRRFGTHLGRARHEGLYQVQFRLKLLSPLDHRIVAEDPFTGAPRELVCFDSNSYLGLHLHPRVRNAAERAMQQAGFGTPSAQLLAGTNRWLCELEQTVAAFHGRPQALIFPSGYATNVGVLTGLLREGDFVARDRLSHASIHDGCVWSGARFGGVFQHADIGDLERLLRRDVDKARGKLIVTDGVFSMHGHLAPLPALVDVAARHGAKLMVDEAHSTGVLGKTGRGLEEHFGLAGSIDVLMGTFSKAPGALGGYVCGSADLVDYLRFFARSGMFTAALPAAICAGLTEAYRVMAEEPEHREKLWRAARRLWSGLRQVGFAIDDLSSPILTIPVGPLSLLLKVGRELFDAGLKTGTVSFPAVPRGEGVLRLSVNARHTDEDIDSTIRILERVASANGLLGLSARDMHDQARGS